MKPPLMALTLLLLTACATTPYAGPRTLVTIDNREWQQAMVELYCDGASIRTVKVPAMNTERVRIHTSKPCQLHARVKLLASNGYIVSGRSTLEDGDRVEITVPASLAVVWLWLR